MDAVAGTCFGFGVRTELPFRFLRDGDGPGLAVTEMLDQPTEAEAKPILEWHITNDGVFHARLYEEEGRFRLWVEGSGSFVIDPSVPSISLPRNGNPIKREARLWAIELRHVFGRAIRLHHERAQVTPETFARRRLPDRAHALRR